MALDLNDKSGNSNTLTNSGGAEVTSNLPFSGKSEAVDLESTESDYLYASDSASLSLTGDFTLECWFKAESLPADGYGMILLSKVGYDTSNRGYVLNIGNNSGTYNFQVIVNQTADDTTRDVIRWTPTITTGTWYHVAVSFDISEATATSAVLYLDGVSQGNGTAIVSGNCSSIYDNDRNFCIGASSDGYQYFDGVITEVRIWNDIRTATEISNNKSVELTGSEANLVAYYPFEELSDISKVSSVSLANIGKISGVAIASVGKISGVSN